MSVEVYDEWVRGEDVMASVISKLSSPILVDRKAGAPAGFSLSDFQMTGNSGSDENYAFRHEEMKSSGPTVVIGYEANSSRMTAEEHDNFVKSVRSAVEASNPNSVVEFQDASTLVSKLRVVKTPGEIECIRQAAEISYKAIVAGVRCIKPGILETDVSAVMSHALQINGAVPGSAHPILFGSGIRTIAAHYSPEPLPIYNNAPAFYEIGACVDRYHASRMHTVWVGDQEPVWFEPVCRVIFGGIKVGLGALTDGALCCDVNNSIRSFCEEGLAKIPGFPRHDLTTRPFYSIGIGMPVDWSENDALVQHAKSTDVVRAGMTFHVLPWMFVHGVGSMGFSTTCVVNTSGPATDLYPAQAIPHHSGRTVRCHVPEPKELRLAALDLKSSEEILNLTCDPGAIADAMEYHKDVDVTPLIRLRCPAAKNVASIHIKDEGARLGQKSFKALGASFALNKLQEAGELPKTGTVCSMTDGNHGAGLAYFSGKMGLGCHIYVPENMSMERIAKLESFGAIVHRPPVTYDEAGVIMMKEAAENGWIVVSDQSFLPDETWPDGYEKIPTWIVCGYTRLFWEAMQQMDGGAAPTHVFIQTGVGGLLGAAILFFATHSPGTKVIAVEPEDAACVMENLEKGCLTGADLTVCSGKTDSTAAGLNCGLPSPALWKTIRAGVDASIAIGDERIREAVRMMYHNPGGRILAGDSGAAGLAGVVAMISGESSVGAAAAREIGLNSSSRVLIINSESLTDVAAFKEAVGLESWEEE
jgi:diaminopropionate ammonia-lyase